MLPGVQQGELRVRLEIGLSSRLARRLRRRESVDEELDSALLPRIRIDYKAGVLLGVGFHATLEHPLESQLLKALLGPRETFVIAHRAPLISASHELGLAVGTDLIKSLGGFSGSELGIGFGALALLGFVKFVVRPFTRQSEGGGRDVALVSATPSLQMPVEPDGKTETLLGLIEVLCAAPAERTIAAFGVVGGMPGKGLGELDELVNDLALPLVKLDAGSASIITVEDFLNRLGHEANDGATSVVEVVLEAPDFSIVLGSALHRFSHTMHTKRGTTRLA
jgi:hypothetical protein